MGNGVLVPEQVILRGNPFSGDGDKGGALRRQGDLMDALLPPHQLRAQFFFQSSQMGGQRRLGDVECPGRGGDAAVLHDGKKHRGSL